MIGVVVTKLGGITQGLQSVAQDIQTGQRSGGSVRLMGVDQNNSILQLIAVMDAYLSAGSGFAVSVEYISPLVKQQEGVKK